MVLQIQRLGSWTLVGPKHGVSQAWERRESPILVIEISKLTCVEMVIQACQEIVLSLGGSSNVLGVRLANAAHPHGNKRKLVQASTVTISPLRLVLAAWTGSLVPPRIYQCALPEPDDRLGHSGRLPAQEGKRRPFSALNADSLGREYVGRPPTIYLCIRSPSCTQSVTIR